MIVRPDAYNDATYGMNEAIEKGQRRYDTQKGLAGILKDNALARSISLLPESMQEQAMQQYGAEKAGSDWRKRWGLEGGIPQEQVPQQQIMQQPPQQMPQLGSMQQIMGGGQNWMQPQQQVSPMQQLLNPPTPQYQQQAMQPQQMPAMQQPMAQQVQPRRLEDLNANELSAMLQDAPPAIRASLMPRLQYLTSQAAESNREKAQTERERFAAEQKAKTEAFAAKKEAEKEQISKRGDIRKSEMKFDETLSKERETNSKIINEAKAMKNIVENNKSLFGAIRGATSLGNLKKLERNPKLREFDRRQADLIVKLSGAQPGASRATDMLRKLIQEGKIDRTQPYDTILAGLKQITEEASVPEREAKAKDRLKKKFGGQLPEDFRTQISDILASEDNPLSYPQWYAENTVFEDDNGQRHIIKNGQWVTL